MPVCSYTYHSLILIGWMFHADNITISLHNGFIASSWSNVSY